MIVFSKLETGILYVSLMILFGILASKAERKNSGKPLIFIVILWGLVAGMRSVSVGIDTAQYHYLYTSGYYTWINDIGFVKLTEILSNFFDFNGYLIIISTIMAFGFIYGLWELRKQLKFSMTWCVVILFATSFMQTMNATRQYFALSFVCFSLHYLFDQKYMRYFVLMMLATSFHASSIIAFLFFPISIFMLWRDNKATSKMFIILSIPVAAFVGSYFYVAYLGNIVQKKIETYLSATSQVNGLFGIIQMFFIVLMAFLTYRKCNMSDSSYSKDTCIRRIFTIIAVIGAVGGLLGYYFKFMDRIFLTVNIFICVFYSCIINIKKVDNKVLCRVSDFFFIIFQSFLVFYPFLSAMINDGYSVMNYSIF